jgi:hypothetical protein
MTLVVSENKLAQFNEFFSINYEFSINVVPLENPHTVNYQSFIDNMPMPFKMASDMVSIDQAALRPLQTLSGVAGQLVDYLNHQSKKIDLLIGYILNQQDEEIHRMQGSSFGGGGITFLSEKKIDLATLVELRIFLPQDNCAVYCYGEVIEITDVNTVNNDSSFEHKVIFHFIREEDREILVRTSLHQQTKQLQQLAKERSSQQTKNDL